MAHYRRQVALARRAAAAVDRLWRGVDARIIAASWLANLGELLAVVSSAQGIAAAAAGVYVDDALAAQGVSVEPAGRLRVLGFAGVASDGRDLAPLLQRPAFTALKALQRGAPLADALTGGRVQLDMIVRTQIADAGRVADAVAIAARPAVTGYVRMLSPPSCSRCLVLAGRRYGWNAGFKRHPRCDCRHIPVVEDSGDDLRTDPRRAFDAMSRAEQDKTFTAAGAQAIREGADIARVVNARRGMYEAGGRKFTTEATTRRGINRRVRIMPEQILRDANGDRGEAIRLLRLHGYIL